MSKISYGVLNRYWAEGGDGGEGEEGGDGGKGRVRGERGGKVKCGLCCLL